jgi:hypothetical protein
MPPERREALLDEFERSGMTGQVFAQWAGVNYTTFANWRQKRRRKEATDPAGPSVPLGWEEAKLTGPSGTVVGWEGRLQIHRER